MSRSCLWLLALFAVGCTTQHVVGTANTSGYLSTDTCTGHTDQASCTAASGCAWLAPHCPAGVPCPPGVCYKPDPCLSISDATTCKATSGCAWSQAGTLCPLGATCASGGYCHPTSSGGGTCGCVTPIACPASGTCPPPECDCSGGGSSGGTCTCSEPPCAPGQSCPPVSCSCGSSGGCVAGGTCTCACPGCPSGQTCPPCNCACGSGGTVPAPPPTATAGPGMMMPAPQPDPCNAHKDQMSCVADTMCQWFAEAIPCAPGSTNCTSGVCQHAAPPPPPGGCNCACPACAPNQPCPPCQCGCVSSGDGGASCVPPPLPTTVGNSSGTVMACPAIACAQPCPNGYKKDANGCPTCTCL